MYLRLRAAVRRRMPGTLYWSIRARRYGARGVMNLRHQDGESATVLDRQQAVLGPLLDSCLLPSDQRVLDFGCGPGRFTPWLAEKVGHAVGVDPVARYLALAPRTASVEYRQIKAGRIPID